MTQLPQIFDPEDLERRIRLNQQQTSSIISKDFEIVELKKEIKFLKTIIENQNKLISKL